MSRGRFRTATFGCTQDVRRRRSKARPPDTSRPKSSNQPPDASNRKSQTDLWTPKTLKQNSPKRLLDTKISAATQHHEAKAPSRDKKERRRSDTKSTRKSCRIIGFPLVLHTSTISMLFCKQRILNATGATRTFCKNRKNREDKYRSFLWPTATFRQNFERRVDHSSISKVENT